MWEAELAQRPRFHSLHPQLTLGPLCAQNKTSTVVKTVLRNDRSPDGIIHHPTILSPIRCIFRNDLLTSLGYTPKWG